MNIISTKMELYGEFPEFLKPHIIDAYNAALCVADPTDIRLLRAPYSELLFQRFYESQTSSIECGYHGTGGVLPSGQTVLDSILTFGMLDPTNIKYKVKNGNAYGPGIYISTCPEYSRNYMRAINSIGANGAIDINNSNCMIIALMIKGNSARSIDRDNTLGVDSVQAGNIVVLRSTSQVLPVFVCSKLLNRFKVIPKPHTFQETDEIMNKIIAMNKDITFNDELFVRALDIQENYAKDVKLGIIYNLIMKIADGRDIAANIETINKEVIRFVTDYDLS